MTTFDIYWRAMDGRLCPLETITRSDGATVETVRAELLAKDHPDNIVVRQGAGALSFLPPLDTPLPFTWRSVWYALLLVAGLAAAWRVAAAIDLRRCAVDPTPCVDNP